jgi:DNA-binding XRE family transcriptional regulator
VKNIETLLAEAMVAVMRLAELREARGVTQADLADALKISQPAVSKIENGADLQAGRRDGITTTRPPQNRTCVFQHIRLP